MSPIDYSKYPANWKTETVPRILKRAKNKCEFCNLENKSIVYSVSLYIRSNINGKYGYKCIWFSNEQDTWRHGNLGPIKKVAVVLTIAHLDHDEINHNVKDDRLAALCQSCHLQYDAKEKMRRKCLNKWKV